MRCEINSLLVCCVLGLRNVQNMNKSFPHINLFYITKHNIFKQC